LQDIVEKASEGPEQSLGSVEATSTVHMETKESAAPLSNLYAGTRSSRAKTSNAAQDGENVPENTRGMGGARHGGGNAIAVKSAQKKSVCAHTPRARARGEAADKDATAASPADQDATAAGELASTPRLILSMDNSAK